MSDVKRYTFNQDLDSEGGQHCDCAMEERTHGSFVLYADYQRLFVLYSDLKRLKDSLNEQEDGRINAWLESWKRGENL